jgi:hypothetical protein
MSSDKDYAFLTKKFEQMKNYVQVSDFRTFLLFNLIDESDSMIQKLMEGGHSMRTLLYEPRGAYLYEYALAKGRLVFYVKQKDPGVTTLDVNKNKKFFDGFLSTFEQSKLLNKQDDKIGIVRLTSKMVEADEKNKVETKFEVTRIYDDLLSFLFDIGKSRYVFVLEGEEDEPNIIFAISILLSNAFNQEYVAVQAYIDKEKKYTGQFLKINSDKFRYESVDEIKEASHSEMFHTQYLLMVKIKSFTPL